MITSESQLKFVFNLITYRIPSVIRVNFGRDMVFCLKSIEFPDDDSFVTVRFTVDERDDVYVWYFKDTDNPESVPLNN